MTLLVNIFRVLFACVWTGVVGVPLLVSIYASWGYGLLRARFEGVLPAEWNYTPNQLDALIMAYVSWLAGSPAEKVLIKGDLYLPAPE